MGEGTFIQLLIKALFLAPGLCLFVCSSSSGEGHRSICHRYGGGGGRGGGGGCDSVEMTELFFLFSGHNTRGNTVPQLPSTKSLSISKIAITGIGSGLCAIVPKTNICRWILHWNFLVIPVKQFSIIRIIRSKSNNLPKRFSITITIIIYSFRLDKRRRDIVGGYNVLSLISIE